MRLRSFSRVLGLLFFAAYGSLAAHAYDSIVVFGDSYNDVGNIYTATGGLYPPAPYYEGRFSNGPIWLDHIAADWGLTLKPSLLGGTDFATGGAELLQSNLDQGLTIPSIEDQVGAYLIATKGKADPNALYVIEGGGNDILDASPSAKTLGPDIAAALLGIVQTLEAAGAKSFLVPQMIDVGQLPAARLTGGQPFVDFASDTSIEVNRILAVKLPLEAKNPGVKIFSVPVYQTFLGIKTASTHFGFFYVTNPCIVLDGFTVVSECKFPYNNLWWDDEHPTEFGHAFFAVLAEAAVSNQ
jgi:phospholipase/lecithinase/hemolysin